MAAPLLPNPIASLMLEDLRLAADYLEQVGAGVMIDPATARRHALRLWSASQGVERLLVAVEQLLVQERARRGES